MQAAKNAAASAKEKAANIAASAESGMDKTKAVTQEKVERMMARDPMEKEIATEKKQERIQEAELRKQEAREENAASRQAAVHTGHTGPMTATGTGTYSTATGHMGHPTGGQLHNQVTEGAGGTDPLTGRQGTHDPRTGGTGTGYGTGLL